VTPSAKDSVTFLFFLLLQIISMLSNQ